jgi:NADH-quinone oxidoreductase subunit E
MWILPGSDELLPGTKTLDKMSKDFSALMPKEFTGSVKLMANPAAGVVAFSALGFGMASQALGLWMGAAAGAAEVSRRMYLPFLDEPTAEDFRDETRTPVKRARAAAKTLISEAKDIARGAGDALTKADKPSGDVGADASAAQAPAAERIEVVEAPKIAEEVAAPPAPQETVADLMPEDFRQPVAMEKPATPDDLKLISGIGPKLEKVLNSLGIWTHAQIAGWSREEIAWVDDYLSFKGRIGRDGWIEQAVTLARANERQS